MVLANKLRFQTFSALKIVLTYFVKYFFCQMVIGKKIRLTNLKHTGIEILL
jgi:hypothetical protein